MDAGTPARNVEHVSDLFVAIVEKLLTEQMLEEGFEDQVTPAQLVALRYISLNEGSLMSDVAEALSISFPAATKTINRLVSKGLASRVKDPHDRRVIHICLTDVGKRLVTDIYRERSRRFASVLERMDPARQAATFRSMGLFINSAIDDEQTAEWVCLHCGSERHDDCPVKEVYLRVRKMGDTARAVPWCDGTRCPGCWAK